MEFELCVPTNDPVSDQQETQDMSFNEMIRDYGWSDQIMEFFTIDFSNSRAEIRQVFEDLESRFLDWIDEQFNKYLRSNQGIAELRTAIGSDIGDDVDPEDLESEIDLAIEARSRAYEDAVESMEVIFREDLGFDDFLDTICRYVVALHLALHPQLERQEYAKKLYKALNPSSNKNQGLELFAQHSAGLITTDQLRQKLLQSDAALLRALGIK